MSSLPVSHRHDPDRQPPTKPSVAGVPASPDLVHGLGSPHIELLARLAMGGGTLTTFEVRELCAAILANLDTHRQRD